MPHRDSVWKREEACRVESAEAVTARRPRRSVCIIQTICESFNQSHSIRTSFGPGNSASLYRFAICIAQERYILARCSRWRVLFTVEIRAFSRGGCWSTWRFSSGTKVKRRARLRRRVSTRMSFLSAHSAWQQAKMARTLRPVCRCMFRVPAFVLLALPRTPGPSRV